MENIIKFYERLYNYFINGEIYHVQNGKDSNFPKLIYRLNPIVIKISIGIFERKKEIPCDYKDRKKHPVAQNTHLK